MSGGPALLDGAAIAATASGLIRHRPLGGEEGAALDHIGGWLAERGVTVSRRDLPMADLRAHPLHSAEVDRDVVPILLARVGPSGSGGRSLLLNAHVDVVPADVADGWTTEPFVPRVADSRLVGRGAVDTLGGLAAAMHVVAALAADPGGLAGEVLLTPVVGEEDGGAGTLATLLAGISADAAVVIEPTDLAVATASAGALCFRVTVPGRTAHGSVRHAGVSAIEKGWLVHRALLELEGIRAARLRHPLYPTEVPFPLCMGRVEGGDYRCDEAAWLVLEGRYGTAPDEPVAEARAELEAAVAAVAASDPWLSAHPPTVEWVGAQWVGGNTPAAHPLITAAARAAAVAGTPVEPIGVPYGCDLGLLRQVGGIPAIVCGPGRAEVAHAVDESVSLADLGRFADWLHALAREAVGR